jgi:predicted Fe-S protein YdhL (DUF1289 family)
MMPPDETPDHAETDPASPCLGICLMDPATRMCRGCLRTIAEIAGWYEANTAEKRTILARLAARRRDTGADPGISG